MKANHSMFGKTHTIETLNLLSTKKSMPVTLYNNNNEYILIFKNKFFYLIIKLF